jgi:hypothetical protein
VAAVDVSGASPGMQRKQRRLLLQLARARLHQWQQQLTAARATAAPACVSQAGRSAGWARRETTKPLLKLSVRPAVSWTVVQWAVLLQLSASAGARRAAAAAAAQKGSSAPRATLQVTASTASAAVLGTGAAAALAAGGRAWMMPGRMCSARCLLQLVWVQWASAPGQLSGTGPWLLMRRTTGMTSTAAVGVAPVASTTMA